MMGLIAPAMYAAFGQQGAAVLQDLRAYSSPEKSTGMSFPPSTGARKRWNDYCEMRLKVTDPKNPAAGESGCTKEQ